ncbi:MAG TPA: hypothetical protein VFO94_15010, partial [Gammaproteobacteria bacterium]|nr:hypothetical protein [Gammaproteobacteria bacterium]
MTMRKADRCLVRLCAPLLALAGLAGACGAAAQTPARVPTNCDRACLEGLVDRYLEAVVAHDPKRLPLSADVKYTENEQLLAVGDGFWNLATARGNYSHYFADPVAGQAAWLGTMRQGDTTLLMSLRLRVQLGRITEIETGYFRPGGGGPNDIAAMDARGKPEALWLETIPPAKRSTRAELIEIANAYFEAVQRDDGKGFYPFTDDCDRIENGAHTTNNPSSRPTPGGFDYMGLDCKKQLESGYLGIVTSVHHRRFPLVDEERGVVWANGVFYMGGTVREIKLNTG